MSPATGWKIVSQWSCFMLFKPRHVTWSHTSTWQLSVSLLFPLQRCFCLCWREANERLYDCAGLESHCRGPRRHRAETWEDKEYRNYRRDAGSRCAETGHCPANSVGRYNGFPFSFLVPVWVLFFFFSFSFFGRQISMRRILLVAEWRVTPHQLSTVCLCVCFAFSGGCKGLNSWRHGYGHAAARTASSRAGLSTTGRVHAVAFPAWSAEQMMMMMVAWW